MKALIIEGGGFKTGFTSGILDVFMMANHRPFDLCVGVSGGAVAASYFASNQYRYTLSAILKLTKEKNFLNYRRTFGQEGYMDIDRIAKVASKQVPFDLDKAVTQMEAMDMRFVATDRITGQAHYLRPSKNDWIDIVVASCTLPFVTKGKHYIRETEYFDGGWSDALPVKWVYEQGATEITILRTWPSDVKTNQSWPDFFGSWYFKDIPGLKKSFEQRHLYYNDSVEFIENPPREVKIHHLTPKKLLRSGTYSYSKKSIMSDYRYGLDIGMRYLGSL